MAKRKKKRRTRDKRFPLLLGAGIAGSMMYPFSVGLSGNYQGALAEVGARFTGYNFESKQFDAGYAFMNGYLPIIMGGLGTKLMTKLGVNREFKKVPYVGKYIKL